MRNYHTVFFSVVRRLIPVESQIAVFLCCVFSTLSWADTVVLEDDAEFNGEQFSVELIETVGDVAVINFAGNYDLFNQSGELNFDARAAVTRELYDHYSDAYDFIFVYTGFEFEKGEAEAFATLVSNEIEGIGLPKFSHHAVFGSAGKLKSVIDMGTISQYSGNPLGGIDAGATYSVGDAAQIAAHEVLHQWSAYVNLPSVNLSQEGHWSFFLNSEASIQYGHRWRDNLDGTFTALSSRQNFNDLDLYLMGLIGAEEVADLFIIDPDTEEYVPTELPVPGISIPGAKRNIGIQEIIAAEGNRQPGTANSQRIFRVGAIYLKNENQEISPREVAKIELIGSEFSDRFSILTKGRAIATISPHTSQPPAIGISQIRTSTSEITEQRSVESALNWLVEQQNTDGSWSDSPSTALRDTQWVISVLQENDVSQPVVESGIAWIDSFIPKNNDERLRLLKAGSNTGDDSELIRSLESTLGGSGWGLSGDYEKSSLDTALAVCAFEANQEQNAELVLAELQNSDGGWGSYMNSVSSVAQTAAILNNLECLDANSSMIASAVDFLAERQNPDGSFGVNSVLTTALVLNALYAKEGFSRIDTTAAFQFIDSSQSDSGDWQGSVYTTTLVIKAIGYREAVNLSVSLITSDNGPLFVGEYGSVDVSVKNETAVRAERSTLRLEEIVEGDQVLRDELRVPSLPAFSEYSATLYYFTGSEPREVLLSVTVDADNELQEQSEEDNKLSFSNAVELSPQLSDLVINAQESSLSPVQITKLPTEVTVRSELRNIGLTNVEATTVELWQGEVRGSGTLLHQESFSVDALASIPININIIVDSEGSNQLTLIADPNNQITENSETNNYTELNLEFIPSIDLEVVEISSRSNPLVGIDSHLTATIRNNGTARSPPASFLAEIDQGGIPTTIQSSQVQLEAGESREINLVYRVTTAEPAIVTANLDSENEIAELNEENNFSSVSLLPELSTGQNLAINFSEFTFSSNPVNEGKETTVSIVVRNTGSTDTAASLLRFFDGNPSDGGQVITEAQVPSLSSGSSLEVAVSSGIILGSQERLIYAVVDPLNALQETNEADNFAFKRLNVVSLPDLEVSPESLRTSPEFPRVGESATLVVEIVNSGMQPAQDFVVELVQGTEGAQQVFGTFEVSLDGNSSMELEHPISFNSFGEQPVQVIVDSLGSVSERRENNNTAVRSFNIQSGEYYVSDRFISPNGDGVKDNVEYVFSVRDTGLYDVVILDGQQRAIRSFEAIQVATSDGSVTWDGRNDLGNIVPDGQYHFAVRVAPQEYVGRQHVTVDTNRSSLSEALESQFLLERNLSCRIGEAFRIYDGTQFNEVPDTQNLIYSEIDDQLYFTTYFEPITGPDGLEQDTGENVLFPTGIYRAAGDGSNIVQLVDDSEFAVGDSIASTSRAGILGWDLSIDGSKLVVVSRARNSQDRSVWIIPTDGGEARKIADLLASDGFGDNIFSVRFGLNDEVLLVFNNVLQSKSSRVLRLEGTPGSDPTTLFDSQSVTFNDGHLKNVRLNKKRTHALISFAGNSNLGAQINNVYQLLNRPFAQSLVLLDLNSGQFIEIGSMLDDAQWNPDGRSFAVSSAATNSLSIYNVDGIPVRNFSAIQPVPLALDPNQIRLLEQFFSGFGMSLDLANEYAGSLSKLTWSPDGSELAYYATDYLASVAQSDGCTLLTGAPAKPSQASDSIKTSSLISAFPKANAQLLGFGCNVAPNDVQAILDAYKPQDGIFLWDGITDEIERVARGDIVNGSFDGLSGLLPFQFDSITRLPNQIATSPFRQGLNTSVNGIPLTSDNLPLVRWSGSRWLTEIGSQRQFDFSRSFREMRWLSGARELLISGGDKNFALDIDGERVEVKNQNVILSLDNPTTDSRLIFPSRNLETSASLISKRAIYPAADGRILSFFTDDDFDSCSSIESDAGYRQARSLLNLSGVLRVTRAAGDTGFELRGIAADKNFLDYTLEYSSDTESPLWQSLKPPSSEMVVDDSFMTWLPPATGEFLVRLVVSDLAGNTRQSIRKISNQKPASITDVELSNSHISPNGDGEKDNGELSFRILQPVNLIAEIRDVNLNTVRSFVGSFDTIGARETISWDGRDEFGAVVPDGTYELVAEGNTIGITVDNTPPDILDETAPFFEPPSDFARQAIGQPSCRFQPSREITTDLESILNTCRVQTNAKIEATIDDQNIKQIILERSVSGTSEWLPIQSWGEQVSTPFQLIQLQDKRDLIEHQFRLVVDDKSGNTTIRELDVSRKRNKAHFVGYQQESSGIGGASRFGYMSNFSYGTGTTYFDTVSISANESIKLQIEHTAALPQIGFELLYREADSDKPFESLSIIPQVASDSERLEFVLTAELLRNFPSSVEIKIDIFLQDGGLLSTNALKLKTLKWQLGLNTGFVPRPHGIVETNLSDESVDRIEFFLSSSGSRTDSSYEEPVLIFVDADPSIVRDGYHFDFRNLDFPPLQDNCGTNYQLLARATTVRQVSSESQFPAVLESEILSANNCEFFSEVCPVVAEQCDGQPSNLVNVRVELSDGDQNPNLLYVSRSGSEDANPNPADILAAINQPVPGTTYELQIDTSDFPDGARVPIYVRLAYADGTEAIAAHAMPIAKQPPSLQLFSPSNGETVCPISVVRTGDTDVKSVAIEGKISSSPFRFSSRIVDGSVISPETGNALCDGRFDSSEDRKKDAVSAIDGTTVQIADRLFDPSIPGFSSEGILGLTPVTGGLGELTIEALGVSGTRVCEVLTFNIDDGLGLSSHLWNGAKLLSPEVGIINPEDEGEFNKVQFIVDTQESTFFNLTAYPDEDESGQSELLPTIKVVEQVVLDTPDEYSFNWNGTDESDRQVPDGKYRLEAELKDHCGNVFTDSFTIWVDSTAPAPRFTSPTSGDPVALEIPIFAEVEELFPDTHELTLVDPNNNEVILDSGTGFSQGLLSTWNTFGASGPWRLRLEAVDLVGNKGESVIEINVPDRIDLISSLELPQFYFSPNNDARQDELIIRLGLEVDAAVTLQIVDQQGNVVDTIVSNSLTQAGYSTFTWDGINEAQQAFPDGRYRVKMSGVANGILQTEYAVFELDNTPPSVGIENQVGDYVELAGSRQLAGSANDTNFSSLEVELRSGAPDAAQFVEIIGSSKQPQNGVLATIPDHYFDVEQQAEITVLARDQAGNETQISLNTVFDTSPPRVEIYSPSDDDVFGARASPLQVSYLVEDAFLSEYSLVLRSPLDQMVLQTLAQDDVSGNDLQSLLPLTAIEDGNYLLELTATDLAGNSNTTAFNLFVDKTPPAVSISNPVDSVIVSNSISILGSATDQNFSSYNVAILSTLENGGNFDLLTTSDQQRQNGVLGSLEPLPNDGTYRVLLEAFDAAGNSATDSKLFSIDTTPPDQPQNLSAEVQASEARLTWNENSETDLQGYHVFRDGIQITSDPIAANELIQSNLDSGQYLFQIQAVDQANLGSVLSDPITVRVDSTPPRVRISEPQNADKVSLLVDIVGTAHSSEDFEEYRLYVGVGGGDFQLVAKSSLSVQAALLYQWETFGLTDGQSYLIRLEAEDRSGNVAVDTVTVEIDNSAPPAPQNLQANLVNGNDVELEWTLSAADTDIAGFLLYRNQELVNATGQIVTEPFDFLISGQSYNDFELPDGRFTYFVQAIDSARNISPSSNAVEVQIETGAPTATLILPIVDQAFGNELELQAVSADHDIDHVVLEFRPLGDTPWQTIAQLVTAPYSFIWDTAFLSDGEYEVRAVATDVDQNTDSMAEMVKVLKRDIDPPSPVRDLFIQVDGSVGNLSWSEGDEDDLAGYNIYRSACQTCELSEFELLNQTITSDNSFIDEVPDDIVYAYKVTAIDNAGNESDSESAVRGIYTSTEIEQLELITREPRSEIALTLSPDEQSFDNAILRLSTGGSTETTELEFEPTEHLESEIFLNTLGPHSLNAATTNTQAASTSRSATAGIVFTGTPQPPQNLVATSSEASLGVALSWDESSSNEQVVGYQLERDSQLLGGDLLVEDATAMASSGTNVQSLLPQSTLAQPWSTDFNAGRVEFGQSWQGSRLVKTIELDWESEFYAANQVDIYAMLGGEFHKIATYQQTEFMEFQQEIDLPIPVPTSDIKLVVNAWHHPFLSGRLNEMRVIHDALVPTNSFEESIVDGVYQYGVRAVNQYGGLSDYASISSVEVGDVTPPFAPILSASVDETDVLLTWLPVEDAENFRIFRDDVLVGQTSDLAYVDSSLANGMYQYSIVAIDQVGNESENSNRESIEINRSLLPPPSNITATGNEIEQTISLAWSHSSANEVAEYRLYRSLAMETELQLIATVELPGYDDADIFSSVEYSYSVTAVDRLGNESAGSERVSSILPDTASPNRPSIFSPIEAPNSIEINEGSATIIGHAEPGSRVFLLHNALVLEEPVVASGMNEVTSATPFAGALNPRVLRSTRGDVAVIWESGEFRNRVYLLQDSDFVELDLPESFDPSNIEDLYWAGSDTARILTRDKVFDFHLSNQVLTEVVIDFGGSVSLEKIEFLDKDLAFALVLARTSGSPAQLFRIDLATGTTSLLTGRPYSISPDGERVVTVDTINKQLDLIVVFDAARNSFDLTGSTLMIDDALTAQWSGNGSKISFAASSVDDSQGRLIFDIESSLTTSILSQNDFIASAWNGEAELVGVLKNPEETAFSLARVRVADAQVVDLGALDQIDLSTLELVAIASDQAFFMLNSDQDNLSKVHPAGRFIYEQVHLDDGDNFFSAIAVDGANNLSLPADNINLVFSNLPRPDLTAEVSINPNVVISSSTATLEITIGNTGQVAAPRSVLQVSIVSPQGLSEELERITVDSLSAGAEIKITVPWEPEFAGDHTVAVEILADAEIDELSDGNNQALLVVSVVEDGLPQMSLSLDSVGAESIVIDPLSFVTGQVELHSPASRFQGSLRVVVQDTEGSESQILIDDEPVTIDYGGSLELPIQWDTSGFLAGKFTLIATLTDVHGQVVREQSKTLTISESREVELNVSPNKLRYSRGDVVTIAATTRNLSVQSILKNALLRVSIFSPLGDLVFHSDSPILELFPGENIDYEFFWLVEEETIGNYRLEATVVHEQVELATTSNQLIVEAGSTLLEGSLLLPSNAVPLGERLQVVAELQNVGTETVANIQSSFAISSQDDQELSINIPLVDQIPIGESQTVTQSLDIENLEPGDYVVQLIIANSDGSSSVLDSASFSIFESDAPEVFVLSPLPGAIINSQRTTSLIQANDEFGVRSVQVELGSQPTQNIFQSDLTRGLFSIRLSSLPEGEQTMSAVAIDSNGNTSNIVERSFVVDNSPPNITVSGMEPDQEYDEFASINFSVTDNHLDSFSARVNGSEVQNGDVLNSAGSYRLVIDASDQAGNRSQLNRRFSIGDETTEPPEPMLNAMNDSLALNRGVWGNIDVLANDLFESRNGLEVDIVEQPKHGSLVGVSAGSYNYFPSLLFVGNDRFVYKVRDVENNLDSTAAVEIHVSPVSSCSFVPDHRSGTTSLIQLPGWALGKDQISARPGYQIEVLSVSDDSLFAPSLTPQINFPECDLIYKPVANIDAVAVITYRVIDSSTLGQVYSSPTRTFKIEIATGTRPKLIVVPIIDLILNSEESIP